ncbi:peptidoglycan glycosyltransferase FtsI [Vibrio sp. MACH09]|uniref:penicillin-binding transpeptidase domain-containing protein n=1 Tax=unclassified Vibrio TaxID=2614977 RepID=UPI001493A7A1|nr:MULTISPECIES: penicillin-binding transpeptidase domain-containing protein [unclassified Vibrio]NOI66128.1 peptidoglycan glycosyltransferase FtsI [Vibrio sp. 99-8-1]GLO61873.1 peptidoglycan glycosyltransferase FtsI [Vibrio sp. MACH09]
MTTKKPLRAAKAVKNNKNANKRVEKKPDSLLIPWRFYVLVSFVFLVVATLIGRVAYIQVIEPDNLIREGDMRSVRVKSIPTARGIISDRNGEQLAVSVPVQAIWADPVAIFKAGGFSELDRWHALADVLGIKRDVLLKKIEKNSKRRFIYLQRQVGSAMANYVKELKLTGIGLNNESRRYYPSGEVSAHLVGVTGIDDHGLEGVERSYDSWLTGEAGKKTIRKDRYGRVVENIALSDSKEGKPLQLTVDQRLQAIAYRAIKQAVADYRATSGSVVILDVDSGEVLAMVNAPSYNPNNRQQLQSFKMRNRTITDSLEPGSTMKPFVVLAALENGTADDKTIIDTGNGVMQIGGSRVRDTSKVGKADLGTILKKSSNIGVANLALGMPLEALLGMYNSVGFGATTGVNLVGETEGIFPNRRRWSKFEIATLSFGYGISVTPIQLAHAYATLGSYGMYRPLHIIEGNHSENAKQVVDKKHARNVLEMLEKVTQKGGTATRAAVPGYRIAAKTGTSRKATAGGYSDEYVAVVAGVAPVSKPKVAMVVIVNEPQGDQYYGGSVAGPVFADIMKSTLQILNIAPDAK